MSFELKPSPRCRTLVASAVVLCVLGAAPADAKAQSERFDQARQAFEDGEFERVVQLLETTVGGPIPTIRDEVIVRESRKYLGAAYVLTGQPELAVQQIRLYLESLESLPADFELPNTRFPAQVNVVVRRVRDEIIAERRETENEAERIARERDERRRAAILELFSIARSVEVVTTVDPLPSFVPFGVGQFTNGDEELGWFFAVSEAACVLLSAAAVLTWIPLDYQNQQSAAGLPGATRVDTDFLVALIGTSWVAGGAFVALAAAGIIEARVSFVPTRRRTIEPTIPDQVLEELELAAAPGAVTVRGRFW